MVLRAATLSLTLALSALATPIRRDPDWLVEAQSQHDTCVAESLGHNPDITTWGKGEFAPIMFGEGAWGALDRCADIMINTANRAAQAQFPGTNVFSIRTDLGIGWQVDDLVTKEELSSPQWGNGREYFKFHVVVFRGTGHLYLNGMTKENERRWMGNAQQNGDTVDFW